MRRYAMALILWMAAVLPCVSQDKQQTADFSKSKVLDLVYTVKDFGGKVLDLQVKETTTEIRIEMAADVLFEFDKADILPKAETVLGQVADLLRQKAKGGVRIEGHTDGKGSADYNQKLSMRRAEAVKAWLTKQPSLKQIPFAVAGYGAMRPVAPNTKPTEATIRMAARRTAVWKSPSRSERHIRPPSRYHQPSHRSSFAQGKPWQSPHGSLMAPGS
jgi:outer membrane protein OmpA-like peptidoglycan-associated protein